MNKPEQIAVMLMACWVAYMVGKSKGTAATTTKPNGTSQGSAPDVTDAPASMQWFTNWGGL